MDQERFQQIEALFHAAESTSPEERARLLSEADSDLRREVESLLARNDRAGPIDRAPIAVAEEAIEAQLTAGTLLGPYRIEAPLGAGGMGQVFRATDTRLGRAVALKISHERFSDRFGREARSISALNHPHICTLYDVGPNYLVMELVEGETLASRLKKGRFDAAEAAKIGAQIAEALSAAHAKAITHRDLKPANIMLGKTGVKVLDFGLAKSANDETLTAPLGVMGTPAYMAPEQREGKACDPRTDIFALGLILREMVTGNRLESGVKLEPPQFAHVVERCLAPDPDDRWQSARDLKNELEWSQVGRDREAPQRRRPAAWRWVSAALLIALALTVAWLWRSRLARPPQVVRLAIATPDEGLQADPGRLSGPPAISPDGKVVVVPLGGKALWLRRLDSNHFEPLAGTGGTASQPFWSPDGRQIAFFAGGKLKKMKMPDGPPETLCDVTSERGGAWSPNGTILFGVNYKGLMRISERGGDSVPVAGLDASIQENSLRFPQFLADGNRFIYFSRTLDPRNHAIFLDSLDAAGRRPRTKLVVSDGPGAIGNDPFSGRDFLLFPKDGQLWAQAFDSHSATLSGEKIAISDDVGQFSLSATGTLVFRRSGSEMNRLAWIDRTGKSLSEVGQPGDYWDVSLSPDERYAAVLNHRSADGRFWIESIDLTRNLQNPLSDQSRRSFGPVWSRDGTHLYFTTEDASESRIMSKSVDAADPPQTLSTSKDRYTMRDLSADGRTFLADRQIGITEALLSSSLAGEFRWRPFEPTRADIRNGRFSPDGRWVVYQSDESGAQEIYVTDFPALRHRRRVSVAGGSVPRWRRDGKEFFYLAPDGTMMSVAIADTSTLSFGGATALFPTAWRGPNREGVIPYDVSHDGKKFLLATREPPANARDLSIVFNWPQLIH